MSLKILFRGLDWLEVVAKFEDQSGHDAYLSDIDRIFNAELEPIVSYLGKQWTVQFIGNNGYRRYLQNYTDGFTLFLDNRSWKGIGHAWPLRIILGKPSIINNQQNMIHPLLWSKPFETMKEMLDRIEGYYGECQHRVSRVDPAVHWTSIDWSPKLQDHAKFVTRLKAPDPIPIRNNSDSTDAAGFVFGRTRKNNINNTVTANIYWVNQRVSDLPNSFDPFDCYPGNVGNERIWNTEFKVYSRTLRSRGIDSLKDLEEKYKGLWVYLTTKCLTLRTPSETDSKRNRWKVDPIWSELQQAFGKGIEPLKRTYQPSRRLTSEQRIKRAESEAKGFITSLPNWQEMSPEERKREFFSLFADDCFSTETLSGYVEKRDLKKVLEEAKEE